MREQLRSSRQADDFDYAGDDELLDYLEELAPHIGRVVIYFISLEDSVGYCLRDLMLRDTFQDERLDVFLSGMLFAGKSRALIHLYGQMTEDSGSLPGGLLHRESRVGGCGAGGSALGRGRTALNIFIDGSSGAIGHQLVPMLVRQGHRFVARTSTSVGAAPHKLEAPGLEGVVPRHGWFNARVAPRSTPA